MKPEQWEDRFWSLTFDLPSDLVAEELIDTFQSELNWYSGFFERYYLQQSYKSWQKLRPGPAVSKPPLLKNVSRDVLYFPALLFQICAVALHFLPPESAAIQLLKAEDIALRNHISERYSTKGKILRDHLRILLGRRLTGDPPCQTPKNF